LPYDFIKSLTDYFLFYGTQSVSSSLIVQQWLF